MSDDEKYLCDKCKKEVGPFSVVPVDDNVICNICLEAIDFRGFTQVCDGCFSIFDNDHAREFHSSIDLV